MADLEMDQTTTARPIYGLLATHVLLCISAFLAHLSEYPPWHSLFFWWLAPSDMACLVLTLPLYLMAVRMGAVLNFLISGMETIALVYLAVMSLAIPLTLNSLFFSALCSAFAVAARVPLGWWIARAAKPVLPIPRGCR